MRSIGHFWDRFHNRYTKLCNEIGRRLEEADPNLNETIKILSEFHRAVVIVQGAGDKTIVKESFLNAKNNGMKMPTELRRFTPVFKSDIDLKPVQLQTGPVIKNLKLEEIFKNSKPVVFHFWLVPESQISVIILNDAPAHLCRELLLETQALIQSRFYD